MNNELKQLNKIKDINQGGCGYVALGLKRKYGGNIIKLIAGFFQEFAHIAVKKDGKVIDSTGYKDESNLKGYNRIEEISEKDLINIIKKKELWSKDFDRNDVSKIEQILDINLNDAK